MIIFFGGGGYSDSVLYIITLYIIKQDITFPVVFDFDIISEMCEIAILSLIQRNLTNNGL